MIFANLLRNPLLHTSELTQNLIWNRLISQPALVDVKIVRSEYICNHSFVESERGFKSFSHFPEKSYIV